LAYGWGWSEKKFDNTTPKYLFQVWAGKRNQIELEYRRDWERTRILGTWVLAPHSKGLTPEKLIKFDWEKQKIKTKEEYLKENSHLQEQWEKLKNE
tara:strand:+ start:1964 stop:2251 length:288 start_codon:yes stop_codon:yes gene_type:complete